MGPSSLGIGNQCRPRVSAGAAPLGRIRQREQVQTRKQEQGERQQCQEAHPRRILAPCYGDAVNDDGHCKSNGQPAMGLPNPFIPAQCDLLIHSLEPL